MLPSIHSTLILPTVTSYPSIHCLQWSADGQLYFASKGAVYILTPDHGINYDVAAAVKSAVHGSGSGGKAGEEGQMMGWFRTIIQVDASAACKWPEHSQEWGAVSLGSIDVTVWMVASSPSGVSPDAGCILAILSSNMDLALWTAGKNCLKGEWVKVCDVTSFLLATQPTSDDIKESMARVLQAQIISIAWTNQPDFGMTPALLVDGSMLIAGNRAGSLIFLRYQRGGVDMELLHTIRVSQKWITNISSSPWVLKGAGKCESFVAFSTADGGIGLVRVTQTLVQDGNSAFGSKYKLLLAVELSAEPVHAPDKFSTTALRWAEVQDGTHILIYCKPGKLYLWTPSPSKLGWSGSLSLQFPKQKISALSSPLHPPSGIEYLRHKDVLVVSSFDGLFYVLHQLSCDPSWDPAAPPDSELRINTAAASAGVRGVFAQMEGSEVGFNDANCVDGMVMYDGMSAFLWVHEGRSPADFSYKHDAKHSSALVTAQLWDGVDDRQVLTCLRGVLEGSKSVLGIAPLQLLRPFLFQLRELRAFSRLHSDLLGLLDPPTVDYTLGIDVPRFGGALTPAIREEFRDNLKRHLFGWNALLSLRMKLSVADFLWKLSAGDEGRQGECGRVAQTLLNTVSWRVLRTITRHLAAVAVCLTADDIPFVLRMVVQSVLPGSPADLSAEGENLSVILQSTRPQDEELLMLPSRLNEACPACGVEVPLQDITNAVCANGHMWGRCSITTFILATPHVRTCIGCSRKAFLPGSGFDASGGGLPDVTRGWIVEELLEAVHRCLFCGNSFVSML